MLSGILVMQPLVPFSCSSNVGCEVVQVMQACTYISGAYKHVRRYRVPLKTCFN